MSGEYINLCENLELFLPPYHDTTNRQSHMEYYHRKYFDNNFNKSKTVYSEFKIKFSSVTTIYKF